jgi:hypothetical protein
MRRKKPKIAAKGCEVCGPWLIFVPFLVMIGYFVYLDKFGARGHHGNFVAHVFLALGYVLMLSYLGAFCTK